MEGHWAPATADEPFRKFLYYVRNFVLPLCRHDCHLELGSFCDALKELLAVRHVAGYTNPLAAADESAIASGGAALPAVGEAGLDPAGWGRFGEALLHPVERRLLDLKTGHLMRRWGEYHERRAQPRDAAHPDTRRALARYAQAIRIHFASWKAIESQPFDTFDSFRTELATRSAPRSTRSLSTTPRSHSRAWRGSATVSTSSATTRLCPDVDVPVPPQLGAILCRARAAA